MDMTEAICAALRELRVDARVSTEMSSDLLGGSSGTIDIVGSPIRKVSWRYDPGMYGMDNDDSYSVTCSIPDSRITPREPSQFRSVRGLAITDSSGEWLLTASQGN